MFSSLRRPIRGGLLLVLFLTILALLVIRLEIPWSGYRDKDESLPNSPTVALVVASQITDNTSWIEDLSPTWDKYIYVADDVDASFTVPRNKGREAMTYLTYIIDHYSTLPEITIFHHANRYQWHNDDPECDAQRLLTRLQLYHVLSQGYANLRCVWTIGCPPDGIFPYRARQPFAPKAVDGKGNTVDYNSIYKTVFEVLFPGVPVPEEIGAPCCAQFAVTKNVIRKREPEEYEWYRRWLLETDLTNDVSGRIMEHFWHSEF